MITRIVKMTFHPERIDEFNAIFNDVRPHILKMDGCISVQLKSDARYNNILFTLSEWEDEASLNKYRQTEFFKTTWINTKALFCAKAEAWTLN